MLVALWPFLLAIGAPQVAEQEYGTMGVGVWAALAYAVVGPLVLTNLLWFTAIGRVGPSHAAIFGNLLPFAAALLAVLLLDESLSAAQVAGGALIALGIVVVRSGSAAPN